MAALPYMPLYVADYMADAAHLSTLQHGAYMLLIMTYWQRGEALPDNEQRLARIARLSDKEWAPIRDDLAEFFDVGSGVWRHNRIEHELAKVRSKTEQARSAGKASAERRFNGRSTDDEPAFNHTDTDTDTSRSKNGSRAQMPADFKPVLTENAQVMADRLGVERYAAELATFRDFHTSKGSTMKDWQAAWRTWLGRAIKDGGRNGRRGSGWLEA